MPMAIIGVARAFNIDLTPYLSAYGVEVYNELKKASITDVLGQYPGLTGRSWPSRNTRRRRACRTTCTSPTS